MAYAGVILGIDQLTLTKVWSMFRNVVFLTVLNCFYLIIKCLCFQKQAIKNLQNFQIQICEDAIRPADIWWGCNWTKLSNEW